MLSLPSSLPRRRFFVALPVLALVASFSLAGCAPTTENPGTPGSAATSAPKSYGDVIVKGTVTDAHGTYQDTQIDPQAAAMKYDPSIVAKSVFSEGFTKAQALEAQQTVAKFVASEVTDSTALDGNLADWKKWESANASTWFDPTETSQIEETDGAKTDRSFVILNNNENNEVPILTRDGKPRLTTDTINISALSGRVQGGLKYIWVVGGSTTTYRTTTANALALLVSLNPKKTKAQLLSHDPQLSVNKQQFFTYQATFEYAMVPVGGQFKIGGYDNHYYFSSNWTDKIKG